MQYGKFKCKIKMLNVDSKMCTSRFVRELSCMQAVQGLSLLHSIPNRDVRLLSVPGVCSSLSRCSRAWWAFCQDGRLQHGHCYKSLSSFFWTTQSKNKEQTQQKKGTRRKQSNRRQIEGKVKRTWKDLNLQTFVIKVCKTSKTTPHL